MPEKPQDVAKAIWNAVEYQKAEIMVGSANFSKAAYQLFPGFMQKIFQKILAIK